MKNKGNSNLNIPNVLSVLRMLLIPLFAVLYLEAGKNNPSFYIYAATVLAISGFTDLLDGVIARRCNQITPLGKILDPLADKLTQVTVVICIAVKQWSIEFALVLMLFAVKELLMLIGGAVMLKKKIVIQGSKWYGKAATMVFYLVMVAVAMFENIMSSTTSLVLILIAAAFMLFAFSQYIGEYVRIMREIPSKSEK